MLKLIILITTLVSLGLLAVLLNITTPATVGPFGVLSIFVLAYILSLGLITVFIYAMSNLLSRLSSVLVTRRPFPKLTLKRAYYFSTILAAVPVMLIGLQSVGAIGPYQLFLLTVFVVIGFLYISKKTN